MNWILENWVSVVAALWALEKFLELFSTLTPWKWDDNVGVILGKLLLLFGGKKTA
jgi:hypothetical protein